MYDSNNIFAKIIRNEIPSNKVYEDEQVLAFHDISPNAPVHVLVIPKGEYIDYSDFINKASKEEINYYFSKINDIASKLQLKTFRLCTNQGRASGQSVFHFHTHILSGAQFGELVK